MRSTVLSTGHVWMLLCFQAVSGSDPNSPGPLHLRRRQLTPDGVPGKWERCGSSYDLEPASATGAVDCVWELLSLKYETISVSRQDQPRLLCDGFGAKVWISPFTNDLTPPTESTFTFQGLDVLNITARGVEDCCDQKKGPTCSGWGILSDGPGNSAIITINHSDTPEPVACNDVGPC
ncbi:hypothetical protein F4825DRAFT_380275 [Nemania diffusa]|nr:hypothetical protein F4825DRAFT_380275 [Nemania diffusa]